MTTIEKLRSDGKIMQIQGVMECYQKKSASEDEIVELQKIKQDSFIFAGRYMSCYATAILDLIGVERYTGNDKDTLTLIQSMQYKEG